MDRQLLEDDILPGSSSPRCPGRQCTLAQTDPRLGAPEDKLLGQAAPRAGAPGGRSPHPYSSCRTVSSYQASHHPGAAKGQYPRPDSSWRTVLLLPRHLIAQVHPTPRCPGAPRTKSGNNCRRLSEDLINMVLPNLNLTPLDYVHVPAGTLSSAKLKLQFRIALIHHDPTYQKLPTTPSCCK